MPEYPVELFRSPPPKGVSSRPFPTLFLSFPQVLAFWGSGDFSSFLPCVASIRLCSTSSSGSDHVVPFSFGGPRSMSLVQSGVLLGTLQVPGEVASLRTFVPIRREQQAICLVVGVVESMYFPCLSSVFGMHLRCKPYSSSLVSST